MINEPFCNKLGRGKSPYGHDDNWLMEHEKNQTVLSCILEQVNLEPGVIKIDGNYYIGVDPFKDDRTDAARIAIGSYAPKPVREYCPHSNIDEEE